jgi:hypothetical protein
MFMSAAMFLFIDHKVIFSDFQVFLNYLFTIIRIFLFTKY